MKKLIVVVVPKSNFKVFEHTKYCYSTKKLQCAGVSVCETKVFILFDIHRFLLDELRATTDVDVLYQWISKAANSLIKTFTDGPLPLLNEELVLVEQESNDVVYFKYPLAEIDFNCDALLQVHDNRKQNVLDDDKKKAQLGVIGVLAMIAQPYVSSYVNTDVTSFSYTATALSTGKWSIYLSEKMIEFGENYEKIMQVANFSWERRYSDNRLKILSEKISCTREEMKPEIMKCFETGHNSNTNLRTCKTLHDFWHHLWDYRTYRKVVEANISELTEGELAKECLECVPLFRFSLLEIYEKDLENILVKRNT